jgi:hypothetical protein
VNETSNVAVSNIFPYVCIRTPIPAPDFAGASPFYYCEFIQQSASLNTGKRLEKFRCDLMPSLGPLPQPFHLVTYIQSPYFLWFMPDDFLSQPPIRQDPPVPDAACLIMPL